MKYVAESPRHFRARGTASHDDEVQRAFGDQRRIAIRTFQNGEDAGAQGLGVTQRVQRIAMLVRSRRAKEIGLRSRGQHQKIALISLALGGLDSASVEIDRDDLRHLHVHVRMVPQDTAQVKSDVAWRQRRTSHLIEQWLELLIVIFVDQRDPNVGMLGQLLGAVQPGKTTSHDHYMFHSERLLFDRLLRSD